MKHRIGIAMVVLLGAVAVGTALSGCGGPVCLTCDPPGEAVDISAAQLQAMIDDGQPLVLADVRTPLEFATGHIPGAVNLPLDDIVTWASTLNPLTRTCCICQSGGRSATAANALVAMGFTQVYNLLGGMNDWPGPTTP